MYGALKMLTRGDKLPVQIAKTAYVKLEMQRFMVSTMSTIYNRDQQNT